MLDTFTRRDALFAVRTGLAGLGGLLVLVALLRGEESSTTEAKKQNARKRKRRRDRKRRKKDRRGKNNAKQHRHRSKKGIPLDTGSVLPESLVTEAAGQLSAHMLLPFEEFSSEAQLAKAVAEGERLDLFILPAAEP